jgi:hypothetical protein
MTQKTLPAEITKTLDLIEKTTHPCDMVGREAVKPSALFIHEKNFHYCAHHCG